MPAVRRGMPHVAASSSSVAGPCARPANNPISLATNKCFAAMKPMAIRMIGSGVTSAITCLPLDGIRRVLVVTQRRLRKQLPQCLLSAEATSYSPKPVDALKNSGGLGVTPSDGAGRVSLSRESAVAEERVE